MTKKTKEKKMQERPDTKGLIILDIVLGILTLLSVLIFGGVIVASVYSPENNKMMDTKQMMDKSDYMEMKEEMLSMKKEMEDMMSPKYDQDSWKSMIDASCTTFFDGCNNCVRADGAEGDEDLAACTRKFCPEYEMPRCMDDEVMEQGAEPEVSEPLALPSN